MFIKFGNMLLNLDDVSCFLIKHNLTTNEWQLRAYKKDPEESYLVLKHSDKKEEIEKIYNRLVSSLDNRYKIIYC